MRRNFSAAIAIALAALLTSHSVQPLRAQTPAVPQTPPYQPVPSASSENARDVMDRVRPSVVQIEGFFGSNTAKAFHGTGFAVSPDGEFITNYHVVAEHVQAPDKFRLEYRTTEGKTGKLTVLAVDVRHDLSLVRADGFTPPPLKLSGDEPAKGERAYSIGFPLNVGLTITEGVSNGKVAESFETRLHYSGAINAGMSGGPALNAAGDVIGINVSGYLFQQLVSFLVPAERAIALRDKAHGRTPDIAEIKKDVTLQLHEHSQALLGALEGEIPLETTSGYGLPAKIAPFFECNATGDPTPNQPVELVHIVCQANAGLHLQQGFASGDITYRHILLATSKLDSWRFANRLSSLTLSTGRYGQPRFVGPFSCKSETIALKGFDANTVICVRSYRKFDGLYDFTVRVSSLDGTRRGFASHLDMSGLEFEPGMKFIRRYIEAMEKKS